VIIVLCAAALAFAFRANRATSESEDSLTQSSGGRFVWGPFLFLHLELLGNVARLSARSGLSSELAGAILTASHAVAIALLGAGSSRHSRWILAASAAALLSMLNALLPGPPALFQVPLAVVACAILLERSLLRVSSIAVRGGSFAFSCVLLILLVFAHYAGYELPFPWSSLHVWIAATVLVAWSALRRSAYALPWNPTPILAGIPLALAGVLAISSFRDSREPVPSDQTLRDSPRVVAFNLHAGFDELGSFAFRHMMENLAAADADVVALQEVSRGWLINGCMDLFELAQAALPIPGVFAPSVDLDWGNAVFSKASVQRVEEFALPPQSLSLSRAVLAVDLRTDGTDPLRILATHFHHRAGDDSIRVLQSRAVVDHFSTQHPSVLLGDFNAVPGSEAMEILRMAGWNDALGPDRNFTYPSKAPDRRIDTIFVRGPLDVIEAHITPEWGSDHRGVVVELSLRK
jgi:endonuclease/exonuclease/phosphatase family metal-dependent hydrolase